MNNLQKVKEALESCKNYDHGMAGRGQEFDEMLVAKALEELNAFMERLESDELVEQVARKICESEIIEYDEISGIGGLEAIKRCVERDWEAYKNEAKAAIKVIRGCDE